MTDNILFADNSSTEDNFENLSNSENVIRVEIEDINTIKKQPSIVTIFSIWNTMVGTSLLTMPWAMQTSGFVLGGFCLITMGLLTFYTVRIILQFPEKFIKLKPFEDKSKVDFAYIIRHYLGSYGFITAILFSSLAFVGALIVFFVLITDFTFDLVEFVHDKALHINSTSRSVHFFNKTWEGMICKDSIHELQSQSNGFQSFSALFKVHDHSPRLSEHEQDSNWSIYALLWDRYYTVPFYMLIMLFSLTHFSSTTFLNRFNAFGIVSQIYLITFVIVKCSTWGLDNFQIHSTDHLRKIFFARPGFYKLTGISLLAFFIHNAIPFIMKAQKNPKNNVRDSGIAFFFVTITYMIFGLGIFIFFPIPKACLFDNLLDNFTNSDVLCTTCRIALFIHLITVYPLVLNILQRQIFLYFMDITSPSKILRFSFNVFITTFCCTFAVFYPEIGSIISFVGALCGFVYSITIPCVCMVLYNREVQNLPQEEDSLLDNADLDNNLMGQDYEQEAKPKPSHPVVYYALFLFNVFLPLIGLLNFLVQFIPLPIDH